LSHFHLPDSIYSLFNAALFARCRDKEHSFENICGRDGRIDYP
jgi:hypothetical protein